MMDIITRFWKEEEGQGLTEYGLILGLVAIVVIGVLTAIGGGINDVLTQVKDALPDGDA